MPMLIFYSESIGLISNSTSSAYQEGFITVYRVHVIPIIWLSVFIKKFKNVSNKTYSFFLNGTKKEFLLHLSISKTKIVV